MRRLTIHESSTAPTRLLHNSTLWAEVLPATIESDPGFPPTNPTAPRLIVRSHRAVTDAESAFAAWSSAGWEAFDAGVARVLDGASVPVLIWPGPGSMLSDAISTLSFARRQPGVGLVIDPVAWISASMHENASEHLARFARALLGCPTVACVVVRPCAGAGLDLGSVASALDPLVRRVGVVATTESDHHPS